MNDVQAFNPLRIIRQSPAKYYEILFDTGTQILPWTEKGFAEEEQGMIKVQMFLAEDAVNEYYRALETAKTLSQPGILHIVAVCE